MHADWNASPGVQGITTTRRRFIATLSGLATICAPRPLRAKPVFASDPYTLGVASGYPTPSGVALWTRLVPEPLAPGGGMPPEVVPVRFEIANDEAFRNLAGSGAAYATPDWAHSVHVEVEGLAPDRWYWYRFHCGNTTSPTGRTRTAPELEAQNARLRFAFASCQHYEHGYYAAYRHMLADEPDLIVHVGDYIYESSWGERRVRLHGMPEPVTLDDYRARLALYKRDPDLMAAHAACPWLVVWDDHEVENDYAGAQSEQLDPERWFLRRRAAAYQAYYEHLPLRRNMLPLGPDMRLHTRVPFGSLASFTLLDDRQYRSPQACPRPERGGGSNLIADCKARLDPAATLLGAQQERWLDSVFGSSKTRWNVLAQQTLMAQADIQAGEGLKIYTDGWDGYPAARARLLDGLQRHRTPNPVVIGGDVHSFWVTDLKPDFANPASPVVASEFVTTSISSQPPPEERIEIARREGPHMHYGTGLHRGYTRIEITPERLAADFRALDDVARADSPCRTLSSWIVEDGRPGPRPG